MSDEIQKTVRRKFEDWERKNHTFFLIIVGLILLWALTPILISVLYGAELGEDSAKIGDTFNWFSSLATGLATVMLVYSISLQRRDLAKQSEQLELQREEMTHQREEMAATARAMEKQVDIASLSAQLNTFPRLIQNITNRIAKSDRYEGEPCTFENLEDAKSSALRIKKWFRNKIKTLEGQIDGIWKELEKFDNPELVKVDDSGVSVIHASMRAGARNFLIVGDLSEQQLLKEIDERREQIAGEKKFLKYVLADASIAIDCYRLEEEYVSRLRMLSDPESD